MMYYFFNRGLDAVLTTKGWIDVEKLKAGSYKILSAEKSANPVGIVKSILQKYGETTAKQTILLKEEKLLESRPKTVKISEKERKIIQNGYQPLVQYLVTKKDKIQQINSGRLFTSSDKLIESHGKSVKKVENEPVYISNITKVETPELEKNMMILNARISTKHSSFTEEITQVSEQINQIYLQAEEISRNYDLLLEEVEKQIEDLLHYVEFSEISPSTSLKFTENLQELRIKRRFIKDSLYAANLLLNQKESSISKHLCQVSEKIQKLDKRNYVVKSPDFFNFK